MSTITLNDVVMEAKVGERLLNVARRNAAHIGFVCDNAGTCQACRCQVLAGEEHLSPPSEAERAWIPAARLAQGQRLACQAIIHGPGPIQVRSRAEELRRMAMAVASPGPGESRLANLQPILNTLALQAADQLALWPGNVISSIARIGPRRFAFPILDRDRFFDDVARVVRRLRTGAEQIRDPASPRALTAPTPEHIPIDTGAEHTPA